MNVLHIVYPVDMALERKYLLLEEMSNSTLKRRITREIFARVFSYHYDSIFFEEDMDRVLRYTTDLCIAFSDVCITGILLFREHGDYIEGKLLGSRGKCGGFLLTWVETRVLPRRPYITKIACRSSLQAVNFYAKYGFAIDWSRSGEWIVMVKDLAHPAPPNVPLLLKGLSRLARFSNLFF